MLTFKYVLSPYGWAAILLAVALSATMGCGASYFACTTKASYDPATGAFAYESCKDQQNFHAKLPNGAEVSTSASTPEAATAAALASMAKILDSLKPMIDKFAAGVGKVP